MLIAGATITGLPRQLRRANFDAPASSMPRKPCARDDEAAEANMARNELCTVSRSRRASLRVGLKNSEAARKPIVSEFNSGSGSAPLRGFPQHRKLWRPRSIRRRKERAAIGDPPFKLLPSNANDSRDEGRAIVCRRVVATTTAGSLIIDPRVSAFCKNLNPGRTQPARDAAAGVESERVAAPTVGD